MEPGRIAPAETDAKAPPVLRRQVFYVSGFDPLGPRRYRELYRKEGPRQGRISGFDMQVEGLPAGPEGAYRWRGEMTGPDGRVSRGEVEFLAWDDIVRHSIRPSLLHTYWLMASTLWLYIMSGALPAMFRLRRGPLIAGLFPVAVMIYYLVFAALAGTAAAFGLAALGLPGWAAALAAPAAFALVMIATRYIEEQFLAYFLVNDLAWSAERGGRYPAALDRRLDHFAARIAAEMGRSDIDELLVVGHSSGAQLAVSAMRRALDRHGGQPRPEVGLLTLGQSIPMTSFLPGAGGLRDDLVALAGEPRLFWLDVSAPSDGACFALVDPVAATRAGGRPPAALNPLVLSAAFRRTMAPEAFARLRWRLFRLHFQYLCAFDHPGLYDYFTVTAGPETLRQRFGRTGCSKSAVTRPSGPVLHPG